MYIVFSVEKNLSSSYSNRPTTNEIDRELHETTNRFSASSIDTTVMQRTFLLSTSKSFSLHLF